MAQLTIRTLRTRSERGFTLIELLIAIAIIAILASVAYPSFMDSVRKSRRAEAVTALTNVQQAQERFRSSHMEYTAFLTNAPSATTDPGLGLTTSTPNGYYTIAIAAASATGFETTATAVSGTSQANDVNCAKLGVRMANATLEYAGTTSTGTLAYAATNRCWSR